jgi:hypothetical protein
VAADGTPHADRHRVVGQGCAEPDLYARVAAFHDVLPGQLG